MAIPDATARTPPMDIATMFEVSSKKWYKQTFNNNTIIVSKIYPVQDPH